MQNNWAIILAAGSSRRMGTQKMLLPYGKKTILETVVDHVLDSNIENVLVVLGPDPGKIQELLKQSPVRFCINEHHEDGMLSSVICGFKALPSDAHTALIYLGDQPNISSSVTNAVLEAYDEDLYGIVIPVYEYRRGHPLLVDLKYRREVEKLDLEQGLRTLRHLFPGDVLEVEVNEPGILLDIDTREDYNHATKTDDNG